ncbi:MAG: hypothetical protein ACI4XB_00670 [Ruminococcus sp.]
MQKNNWKRIAGAAFAAALAATQVFSAMPAFAEEETGAYVYGTVNLPYADYYYGELNDVAANAAMDLEAEDPAAAIRAEGYYDAVTSATNVKSVKYGSTYYTENEDGSVTVSGIQEVAIAVPQSLYDEATAAMDAGSACSNQLFNILGSMTLNADQTVVPEEYKILNGDGTLTAMIDANEAVTVDDASITVQTNTTYGNYQISIVESTEESLLPDSDTMEGVVITTSDGCKYAMLHVDNLWLRTGEIAWAIEDGYLVHNANTLKYKSFTDTIGKTITSVRYIIRGGSDVTFTTESYLPVLHDGTVTAEDTPVTAGTLSIALADLPEDYAATAEAADLNTSYSDGVLTYEPTGIQPGSYSIVVSDTNGVYASISTSVTLTTDDLPAAFDADTNTVIAAEGADETAFANYLANMSTATVNGTTYKLSGRGSVKLFDLTTGALDLNAVSGETAVFGESGTYEIVVSATGYTTDLAITLTVSAADNRGDVDQDGAVTANDAYAVLVYYANISVGKTDFTFSDNSDPELEASLVAAADADGNGVVDANDAYYILLFYAKQSVGEVPVWDEIVSG